MVVVQLYLLVNEQKSLAIVLFLLFWKFTIQNDRYTLPFVGADGYKYTLQGVKHMPGNDCLKILSQVTTLYCHVKNDSDPDSAIVRKGIAKISPVGVIDLIASIRVKGGGGVKDQIEGFLQFGLFLLGDVGHNCLNLTSTSVSFDYFWVSDAKTGILLDMIKR